jgi:hypothetical protein
MGTEDATEIPVAEDASARHWVSDFPLSHYHPLHHLLSFFYHHGMTKWDRHISTWVPALSRILILIPLFVIASRVFPFPKLFRW